LHDDRRGRHMRPTGQGPATINRDEPDQESYEEPQASHVLISPAWPLWQIHERVFSVVVSVSERPKPDDFHLHGNDARPFHLQDIRRGGRDIDDAIVIGKWSAVIDAHVHAVPVQTVRHPHDGAERKMPVRGGKVARIEFLAARGLAALLGAVPGGQAMKRLAVMVSGGGGAAGQQDQDEDKSGPKMVQTTWVACRA